MTEADPSSHSSEPQAPLAGYEILVGVSGSIACYKAAAVVSKLVQLGAGVSVAMTRAARRFVGPITFEALTGREVFTSLWRSAESHDPQHLSLTDRADLVLLAPATANLIAKAAAGIADDLLSTLFLSARCPIFFAPAMNPRMWENSIVQSNAKRLIAAGWTMIGPGAGWVACREEGQGRMSEPEEIIESIQSHLLANPRQMTRA